MPDPIISDDDAKRLFEFEADVERTRSAWESLKEQTKDAKSDFEEARERYENFGKGLRERHPLFDRADDDEPLRIAQ